MRWCARADALFNSAGMHLLHVQQGHRKLVITVETDAEVTSCRSCGVVARPGMAGAGSRRRTRRVSPVAVLIVWLKRVWGCAEPGCAAGTWSGDP